MPTKQPVKFQELSSPDSVKALEKRLRDIIIFNEINYAFNFYRNVSSALRQVRGPDATSDVYKHLELLATQAGWVALPILKDPEVYGLFHDKFRIGLSMEDFLIVDTVRAWVSNDMILEERDELKSRLRQVLTNNLEILTSTPLMVNESSVKGTCNEWYKEFTRQLGMAPVDSVKRSQYFSTNNNFRRLAPQEQSIIKKLFALIEYVQLPSTEPIGLEEEIPVDDPGREGVIRGGKFERINLEQYKQDKQIMEALYSSGTKISSVTQSVAAAQASQKTRDPMDQLRSAYANYRHDRQRVLDIEDKVLVKTKGDPHAIYHELSSTVQAGEKLKALACLKLLARQKALTTSLRENPAWWESTAEYIAKKYIGQFPAPEVKLTISDLKYNPITPAVISEFLQFILESRLRISRSESALIGVEIGQLLGGEYQSMAYGNAETGEFEWVKNKIADRKLVCELVYSK